ncbi:MAG: hypothetical protein V4643_12915 [Bacteroidota bacterium]
MNKKNSMLKYLLVLLVFAIAFQCDAQNDTINEYDLSASGTLDSTESNTFETDYFVTAPEMLQETVVNLNDLLGVEQLVVGVKYTTNVSYLNNYQFLIKLMTPTLGCTCASLNISPTNLSAGQTGNIGIDILPTVDGARSFTVKIPIVKVADKPTMTRVIAFKTFKFTYTAIANTN